nr:putative activating signal cointegrator 1 complex subunit 2 [Biomphalaria glabrata]
MTGDEVTGDEVTGDEMTGDEVTGDEVTGDEVTGNPDFVFSKKAVPAEITPHKNNLIQAPLSALTTGQDKRELNVVPELAITGQREHIGEHDVTLIF